MQQSMDLLIEYHFEYVLDIRYVVLLSSSHGLWLHSDVIKICLIFFLCYVRVDLSRKVIKTRIYAVSLI